MPARVRAPLAGEQICADGAPATEEGAAATDTRRVVCARGPPFHDTVWPVNSRAVEQPAPKGVWSLDLSRAPVADRVSDSCWSASLMRWRSLKIYCPRSGRRWSWRRSSGIRGTSSANRTAEGQRDRTRTGARRTASPGRARPRSAGADHARRLDQRLPSGPRPRASTTTRGSRKRIGPRLSRSPSREGMHRREDNRQVADPPLSDVSLLHVWPEIAEGLAPEECGVAKRALLAPLLRARDEDLARRSRSSLVTHSISCWSTGPCSKRRLWRPRWRLNCSDPVTSSRRL
jgi:hypothetical protein